MTSAALYFVASVEFDGDIALTLNTNGGIAACPDITFIFPRVDVRIIQCDDNAGSLSATGGSYGAGIGGGLGVVSEDHYTTGTSNISITGGDISATGGAFGAGIGGGGGGATVIIGEDNEEIDENVSGIHVSGGTLTALGTEGGAGIGGGRS